MESSIIADITNFIFVSDEPQKSDMLFLPGGSDPAIPERAACLYHQGYAPRVLPAGGTSVKTGVFNGVKRKRDVYSGDYKTECAFYTDVLVKNAVPASAIVAEAQSGYTIENALFSRRTTDQHGLVINRAIV